MQFSRSYPSTRMRRLRSNEFIRELVVENNLTVNDLIYPCFVTDQKNSVNTVAAMPGVTRYTTSTILNLAEECVSLGVKALALFPVVDSKLKSQNAQEAFNSDGLIPRVIRLLKNNFPELGLITDIALDPYTSHGQDGIIDDKGVILNDITIEILKKQALTHADAGVDIVAPSDMMDGRVGAIRSALEGNSYNDTIILSYAAKYASNLYSPFRDAVQSSSALLGADKKTYQMDIGNSSEAFYEVALDIKEGADIVMVKPALAYLDIVAKIKTEFNMPIFVYNVSGEYAMVKAAAQQKLIDERKVVLEFMLSFKRAGADAILTYHALDCAKWLAD